MAKQLRMIDRLLLGLAFIDEYLGSGYRAVKWIRSMPVDFWTPPNYHRDALKQGIYRLLKAGYLEKRVENGVPQLVISNKGHSRVERKFSYFKLSQKRWDGYWRLVIFDIKEKDKYLRERLRAKLKELGFGMWQKSIYLSPHPMEEDMNEFLKAEKLLGRAYVLRAENYLLGEARDLAEEVWHLTAFNQQYLDLETKADRAISGKSRQQIEEVKKVCYDYSMVLEGDPCLPKELLPDNWARERVQQKIARIIKSNT